MARRENYGARGTAVATALATVFTANVGAKNRMGIWINNRSGGAAFNAVSIQAIFGTSQQDTAGVDTWIVLATSFAVASFILYSTGAGINTLAAGSAGWCIVDCAGISQLRIQVSTASATTVDTSGCAVD
jgi:hypothetical protein